MAVFNASTLTPRRVADPGSDNSLPSGGSLNWGAITSPTALQTTNGYDCKKITGDQWHEITGSLTENYTADKTISVKGKHTEKVTGNRSITVVQGNMDRTVSAGKVVDKVAQSQEVTVGTQYKLEATNISESAKAKHEVSATMVDTSAKGIANHTAGGVMTVRGSLVKINC